MEATTKVCHEHLRHIVWHNTLALMLENMPEVGHLLLGSCKRGQRSYLHQSGG